MKDMIQKLTDNSVKLCCNGNGCPTITKLENGEFTILDDYGNTARISKEEILAISEAAKTLLG